MLGTSSNFIDFLVAVFAMVLMLMSHKLIKSFLDHIFPGGHGHGPGALLSGLMEGVGMAAGRKMFNTGLSALKTGTGMMGAGGIAGAASALAHMRSSKAFGKDGFLGGAFQNDTSAPSPLSDEGLYPGALPPSEGESMGYLPPNGFTMPGMDGESSSSTGSTFSGSTQGGDAFSGAQASAGPTSNGSFSSAPSFGSASGTSGSVRNSIYDGQTSMNGARTQLRPSAATRLNDLDPVSQHRRSNVVEAFMEGAAGRVAADAKHKLSGGRGYAGGAKNLFSVAGQEFGADDNKKLVQDSYLPSAELTKAARSGDGYAMSDMQKIGQYQNELDEGIQWYEQGSTLQHSIQPSYDSAKAELDSASHEVDGLSATKYEFEKNGDTSSPLYQKVVSEYESAMVRQTSAGQRFKVHESQMKNATDMVKRGEQRISDSQKNISNINWGWYPGQQQSSGRLLQAAQARANRTTLSDLGRPPGGRR